MLTTALPDPRKDLDELLSETTESKLMAALDRNAQEGKLLRGLLRATLKARMALKGPRQPAQHQRPAVA